MSFLEVLNWIFGLLFLRAVSFHIFLCLFVFLCVSSESYRVYKGGLLFDILFEIQYRVLLNSLTGKLINRFFVLSAVSLQYILTRLRI